MNKKSSSIIRFLLLIIAILAAIFIIFILPKLGGTVTLSKPGQNGNSAGNLYNTGLFCESNDCIYFSNLNDDGTLYSMNSGLTDFKKLSTDKIQYINADDNYIYYSRINNMKEVPSDNIFIFFNTGLFRINKSGADLAMLLNKPIGLLNLYDNKLFYQYYDEAEGISIHTCDINGDNDIRLLKEDSLPASIFNNNIYYTATIADHSIHRINIDGDSENTINNSFSFMPIAGVHGIYYISTMDNYSIHHSLTDGSEDATLIDGMCSSYNISSNGRYLFYQIDGSDQNGIFMFDTVSNTSSLIAAGDYKWLHTVSDYLFFYSFDGKYVYTYKPGGAIMNFAPPNLSN